MGGEVWHLWEAFDDEGAPPRILESGRWLSYGWLAFWHHALLGLGDDAVTPTRLRLWPGPDAFLVEGWEELPGVTQLRTWAASDLGVLDALVRLQNSLDGLHPSLGPRLVTELFAHAATQTSGADFIAHARAEHEELSLPPHVPTPKVLPTTTPFADRLERAIAQEPERYGWLESRVDRIPKHAQLVGAQHEKDGAPAPGSVWWQREEAPDEWTIACHWEVYQRELSSGSRVSCERVHRQDAKGEFLSLSNRFLGILEMQAPSQAYHLSAPTVGMSSMGSSILLMTDWL